MITDNVKLYVKAGDGGDGNVAFHREKYVSHGGPDGGDGGRGGDVTVQVSDSLNTLVDYKYRHKFVAENGAKGLGDKMHGKNGEDVVLKVPRGTVIRDEATGEVIRDMSAGEQFVLCRGGRGGWGNMHFATPTRQIPRFAKSGMSGEEKNVIFELKMLADVGLVGLPNAGKSSLLSMISAARPKIAAYKFTTLSPSLGVVRVGDSSTFVVADIPGLIEGASEGAGLGHEFLRHVERCRLLVNVVDASGEDGDPVQNLELIDNELSKYSPELGKRPQIIAANKYDLKGDEGDYAPIKKFADEHDTPMVLISAATGFGMDKLIEAMVDKLNTLPPIKVFDSTYVEPVKAENTHGVTIRVEDGKYIVEGEWLKQLINDVNFDDRDSLMYFQRHLRSEGVIDALNAHGIKEGDTVSIYGLEFDFVN